MPDTLIENYVIQLDGRLKGLEDNLQKLTTIVNKIVNDQAVFDFKQEQTVRVSSKLEEMVDKAREKLEGIGTDFIKECDKREARLNESLQAYKRVIDKASDKRKDDVDDEIERLEGDIKELSIKVDNLLRWFWLATGGGAVAVFIFEIALKVFHIA